MKKEIVEYKPIQGFYDLREFNIPKKQFKALHRIQLYLKHVEDHKKYFKKYNFNLWQKAQELSCSYQNELFSYDQVKKHPKQMELL